MGAGLIGLLTAALLSKSMSSAVKITLIDINSDRLSQAASFLPNIKTWNPNLMKNESPPFDAVIEVSGHSSGLQTAIVRTKGTYNCLIIIKEEKRTLKSNFLNRIIRDMGVG